MAGKFGVDFAWGRPSIAELKAAGVTFVGRYFSHDPSKDLSGAEFHAYRTNGIGTIVAWETTAERTRGSELDGQTDAHQALARAQGMGYEGPICFAIDFDAAGPEVEAYFRGAHSVAGGRCGAYGGYRPIAHLFDSGLIHEAWQTYAWSGGQWDRRARWRQYSNDHSLAGVSCDYDVELVPDAPAHAAAATGLNVLLPAERRLANTIIAYRAHPRLHPHGIKVTREALIRARKEVWLAAERGLLADGRKTQPGWHVNNREARYALLWKLTG